MATSGTPSPGSTLTGAAEAADPRIGETLDKYTIVRVLGRGGMGAVYEARHNRLARRVAIKFLLPQYAAHPDVLRRFENEAQAAGSLEHPNVAAVMDLGRANDGSPYLVMEFLEGEDCGKLLQRTGPMSVQRAANIVVQACRGLAVAHANGIVHRDLKPENLFIARAGDGGDWVKVLDFGIAKLRTFDGSAVTRTGVTLGTAHYMAPEQARGAAQVDERADVWSLGVLLYQLVSGRRPFEGNQFLEIVHQILSAEVRPLSETCPTLHPTLISIVQRAMHKDVLLRTPSVGELAEALAPFSGAPPPPSAQEVAHTQMPATVASPTTSVEGVAIGNSVALAEMYVPRNSDAPVQRLSNAPSLPAVRAKSGVGRVFAIAFGVAAVAGAFGWTRFAASDSAVNAPPALSIPAAAALVPVAPGEADTSLHAAANAASVPTDLVVGVSGLTHSSGITSPPVPTLSERPSDGSNNKLPAQGWRGMGSDAPRATPETKDQPENGAEKRAIDIEKNNPYDP